MSVDVEEVEECKVRLFVCLLTFTGCSQVTLKKDSTAGGGSRKGS